ncbi:sodium channel subunit beta-4-like [Pundamilia nyererei]|uniref:Sodium channel subunit beta-4-like n=1 Tax=Pundamilia nyererei TaxID=303518 RepID=A0A3B4GDV3_9CICH|nr:PREDICTED: sodium channel subunit beta-4-like [Pundamilia nyererei]
MPWPVHPHGLYLWTSVGLLCLLCSLSSGSSQSVRTGFIGDEVLLPCVYSEQLSEPVTAFWRDKDDKIVLDIINGKEDKMDPKFRGRVFSFPNHYKTGNLSILIKGLRADDAGPYDCDIPKVDYQAKMTLKVTEKPGVVKITTPHPDLATISGAAVTCSNHHLLVLLSALFVLFCSLQ